MNTLIHTLHNRIHTPATINLTSTRLTRRLTVNSGIQPIHLSHIHRYQDSINLNHRLLFRCNTMDPL